VSNNPAPGHNIRSASAGLPDPPEEARTVLDAAKRLLEHHGLRHLSVTRLSREANVPRGALRSRFRSPHAVLAALVTQSLADLSSAITSTVGAGTAPVSEAAMRAQVQAADAVWRANRHVFSAAAEEWSSAAEVRQAWTDAMDGFATAASVWIERQRTERALPPGVDARILAATLVWTTERCAWIAGLDDVPLLPRDDSLVDVIVRLWWGALHAPAPPA
jgi:AcrR family transcriptional regulator